MTLNLTCPTEYETPLVRSTSLTIGVSNGLFCEYTPPKVVDLVEGKVLETDQTISWTISVTSSPELLILNVPHDGEGNLDGEFSFHFS